MTQGHANKQLLAAEPRVRSPRSDGDSTFLMAALSLLLAALLLLGALGQQVRVDFAVPALMQGAPIIGRLVGAEGQVLNADDHRIAILLSSDHGLWWDSEWMERGNGEREKYSSRRFQPPLRVYLIASP